MESSTTIQVPKNMFINKSSNQKNAITDIFNSSMIEKNLQSKDSSKS